MNKLKIYLNGLIFGSDCIGKQDFPLCCFVGFASNQYIMRSAYFICMILISCFFTMDSQAQQNTAELVEEIKTLLPYRTIDFKMDHQLIPTALSIKAANYTGIYNYAKYLKQSFSNGTFDSFNENCVNHIASKKITPPSDNSIFKEKPSSEPLIFD